MGGRNTREKFIKKLIINSFIFPLVWSSSSSPVDVTKIDHVPATPATFSRVSHFLGNTKNGPPSAQLPLEFEFFFSSHYSLMHVFLLIYVFQRFSFFLFYSYIVTAALFNHSHAKHRADGGGNCNHLPGTAIHDLPQSTDYRLVVEEVQKKAAPNSV